MDRQITTTAPDGQLELDFQKFAKPLFNVPVYLSNKQLSTLYVENLKARTFSACEKKVLEFQAAIKKLKDEIDTDDKNEKEGKQRILSIADIEARISDIAKIYDAIEGSEGIAYKWRGRIRDWYIEPAMSFGKQINPKTNPDVLSIIELVKDLKRKDQERIAANSLKENEKKEFVSHYTNDNIRRVAEYKVKVFEMLDGIKTDLLADAIVTPDLQVIKETVNGIKFPDQIYFTRVHLTKEEAIPIYNSIPKPDQETLKREALATVDSVFKSYKTDLELIKSKPDQLTKVTDDIKSAITKVKDAEKVDTSITNFAKSAVAHTEIKPEYKPLKKKVKIVIEETEEWQFAMLGIWMSEPGVRSFASTVSGNEKRTDKQRIEAINKYCTENEKTFPQFKYVTEEK